MNVWNTYRLLVCNSLVVWLPQTNNSWPFNVTNSVCLLQHDSQFLFVAVLSIVFAQSRTCSRSDRLPYHFFFLFFSVWHSHSIKLAARESFWKFQMQFSLLYGLNIFLCGQNKTADDPTVEMCCLTIHISLFLFPLHAFAISNILYSVQRIIFLRFSAFSYSAVVRERRKKYSLFFLVGKHGDMACVFIKRHVNHSPRFGWRSFSGRTFI